MKRTKRTRVPRKPRSIPSKGSPGYDLAWCIRWNNESKAFINPSVISSEAEARRLAKWLLDYAVWAEATND